MQLHTNLSLRYTLRGIFFIFLLLFAHAVAIAQIKVEAIAPSSFDMSEGYFQVRYKVNTTDVEAFEAPDLSQFEVRSTGPYSGAYLSTSHDKMVVNGKVVSDNSSKTFTFTLTPKQKGKCRIGKAKVVVNGTEYYSQPLEIEVTDKGVSHNKPVQLKAYGTNVSKRDLYITVSAQSTSVYENEAILVTYHYFARPSSGFHNIYITEKPNFKDVVVIDVPLHYLNREMVEINGESYYTGVCNQMLVIPQHSGKLVLPSIEFICEVLQKDPSIDDMIDVFFNTGYVVRQLKRNAPELTLNVEKLPQPEPTDFTGAVGQYSLEGGITTPHLQVGEMANYQLKLKGVGNAKMASAPILTAPNSFEVYTPQTEDHTSPHIDGLQGEIIYNYTFVPRSAGKVTIPSAKLSYFDPTTNTYVTLKTDSLTTTVLSPKSSGSNGNQPSSEVTIRSLHSNDFNPTPLVWSSVGFWLGMGLMPIVFAIFDVMIQYLLHRRINTAGQRKQSRAARYAERRMKRAARLLQSENSTAYYAEVVQSLYAYLTDRFNMSMAQIGREQINNKFDNLGIEQEVKQSFLQVIDACEYAQYAPQNHPNNKENIYKDAIDVIIKIEQSLKNKR